MARCPFAVWRPMPYGSYLMPNPVRANLHTAVSSASSLYSHFATRSGKVHSHFYVAKDGTIEQYRDTAYAAAAVIRASRSGSDAAALIADKGVSGMCFS